MATLKYDEKFPAMVEELAAKGEPDARIASRLGISVASFYNYKQQFPEFAEALVAGRKLCYSRVRAKLLQVAQGHCSVTTEVYKNGELYKTTRRWLPPNLRAIIYFQKNMRIGEVTIKDGRLSGLFCWPQGQDENSSAQQHSKIYKSGMGHMGLMRPMGLMANEKGSVEEDSKISSPLRPSSPFSPLNPAEEYSKISSESANASRVQPPCS
jgi:hypothetical protein